MNFPNAPFQSIITEASGKLASVWSQWFSRLEYVVKTLTMAGSTSERPTSQLWTGQRYWDSTLNQLVVWNGSQWVSSAVGAYGSFYDTTDQAATSPTIAYAVRCNNTAESNGITLVDSNKITFLYPGTYNIQFSFQFVNTASAEHEVDIWFRFNGANIDNSNSRFTVPSKHGSINGHLITALNFIVSTTANNQYVQIMWCTDSTTVSIETLPSDVAPIRPATPSAIITAQQI